MRDSWIDRDELDELVGSFSPARKGKGRRNAARPKKAATDSIPATEPAAGASEGRTAPPPSDPSGGIAESPSSPEVGPSVMPPLAEVPETAPLAVFEFDDESDEDFDPVDEADEIAEAPSPVHPSLPPIEALTDEVIEIEILETLEPAGSLPEMEEAPPPLPECVEELPVTIEPGEDTSEEIAVAEEASGPTEPILPWEEPGDSFPDPALEPEVIVSAAPEEVMREVPLFLDDSDDFVPRNPSLSERDADRALIALAEARAKVEQGRLLRIHREEPAPEESTSPSREETALVARETPVEFEEETVAPVIETIELTDDRERGEAVAPEPLTLTERIERYVVRARTELGASAAAISDRDGFLLFAQSESGSDADLETALLLEVAGKTDLLLGLEHGRATQVSTDGGAWRCLIRGGEGVAELYAGFRMPRPLDQEEIARWRKALAEVLSTPLE